MCPNCSQLLRGLDRREREGVPHQRPAAGEREAQTERSEHIQAETGQSVPGTILAERVYI